jgi:hypothetical protein
MPLMRTRPSRNTVSSSARPKTGDGFAICSRSVARMSSRKGNTAELTGSSAENATLGSLRERKLLAMPNSTAKPPITKRKGSSVKLISRGQRNSHAPAVIKREHQRRQHRHEPASHHRQADDEQIDEQDHRPDREADRIQPEHGHEQQHERDDGHPAAKGT